MDSEEKTFENVNGRTDDGQKVITIAHPEHSSGELIKWVDNHQMIITAKYGSHGFTGHGESAS